MEKEKNDLTLNQGMIVAVVVVSLIAIGGYISAKKSLSQ
jgi:hypothetical protein